MPENTGLKGVLRPVLNVSAKTSWHLVRDEVVPLLNEFNKRDYVLSFAATSSGLGCV